jgi:hypothetical protein
VTTSHFTPSGVRNEASLNTWIEYHLKDFDKIFIFVDKHDQWDLYYRDHEKIMFLPGFNAHHGQNYRQVYNVNIALRICLDIGIDWLLHIDDDELFYDLTGGQWVFENFEQIHFRDLEVLQTKNEVKNRFLDVPPIFKLYNQYRNKSGYPYHGYHFCKSAVRVRPWTRNKQITTHFFTHFKGAAKYSDSSFILHYLSPTIQGWIEVGLRFPRMMREEWLPGVPDEFWYQTSHLVHDAQESGNWNVACEYWDKSFPQSLDEIVKLVQQQLLVRLSPFSDERPPMPPVT